jgi:hypothetical protein
MDDLSLQDVLARMPGTWGLGDLTDVVQAETPRVIGPWRVAVDLYRRRGLPYGDSGDGLLRFLEELRG